MQMDCPSTPLKMDCPIVYRPGSPIALNYLIVVYGCLKVSAVGVIKGVTY